RGGDPVELVRVVEHGCLCRSCGARVVVRADRVQELRADSGLERRGALLDHAQPQVDVTEEAALLGRLEDRPACPLDGAGDALGRRSPRGLGWTWAISRQIVATPTVCSSSPPA